MTVKVKFIKNHYECTYQINRNSTVHNYILLFMMKEFEVESLLSSSRHARLIARDFTEYFVQNVVLLHYHFKRILLHILMQNFLYINYFKPIYGIFEISCT